MKYVALGKTGLTVSEIGMGCIPIIRLQKEAAVRVLRHAFNKGVTFFDTANAYRDSEEKIGEAFSGIRHKVVLASKTLNREGGDALQQLENSLKMLKTDYLDLYQLHQIAQEAEWDKATGPGGAFEAVMKAKSAGKVRFVGATSHNLSMAVKMAKSGLFDTIQFPFNLIEEGAADELVGVAHKMGMGFICMKPFGGGVIDNAEIAFKFLRGHRGVIPIPGFESCEQVDQVVSIYEAENSVTDDDRALMAKYRAELGKVFCRRCEYCQPCPQGVMITPAMGYPIIASRMGVAATVQFSKVFMESVALCTECGTCLERCPYELPIPEILRKNYALYESHLKLGAV